MLRWMLYANLVALVLSVAAASLEQAAKLGKRPGRWFWLLAIVASVALPVADAIVPPSSSRQLIEIAQQPTTVESTPALLSIRKPAETLLESARTTFPDRWIYAIWVLASVTTAGAFALGYAAVIRRRNPSRFDMIGGQSVVVTRDLGPAVAGWFRPTILLPQWIDRLTPRQRALIVAHERQHIRSGDVWLLGAAAAAVIAFPWNVFLWWQLRRLRLAIEIDCDRRVLREHPDAVEYGQVLLDAARLCTSESAVAVALVEAPSSLEMRIRTMLRTSRSHEKYLIAMLLLTSVAMVTVAANVESPPGAPRKHDESVGEPRVLSPQAEHAREQESLVAVIEHFEPQALAASGSMTPFIYLMSDDLGRIVTHAVEFHPTWQRDQNEAALAFPRHFEQRPDMQTAVLQIELGPLQSRKRLASVVLGIDRTGKPLQLDAPRLELSAIFRDNRSLTETLLQKADNERRIIERADALALSDPLSDSSELWIVLDADGHLHTAGRRTRMTDPNESRAYVQQRLPSARIGEVSRGTAVKDASGRRVPVTWHWIIAD